MNQGKDAAAPQVRGFTWIPAVFVSSFAVMAVELALTRLFSVVLWYHFVFIAVSMTIFGLALGGLLIDRSARVRNLGTLLLAWGGGGIILMMAAIDVLPLAAIWPAYLLFSVPPFIFLGAFQALAFSRYDRPGHLYFADLLGAALSSAGTIAALRLIPLPAFVAGVALILVVAGVVLDLSRERSRKRRALLTGGILLPALVGSLIAGLWEMKPSGQANKQMYQVMANTDGRVLWTRWNEMSRVDVVDPGDRRTRYIFTDGGAVSFMYRFDGDLRAVGDLRRDNGFFPLANGDHERVAIVGAGGGKDVLVSLLAGAKKITAIEINRGVVEAMERFRGYNGALYDRPDVQLVTGDGRRFLENTGQRFDVIYLPLVMTQAAGSIGQGLVENHTFTKEAFRTYLRKLTPGGRLVLKLHDQTDLAKAVFTAVQVLGETVGETRATRHLYILNGMGHGDVMYPVLVIGKAPLSTAACRALMRKAGEAGFSSLYFPHHLEEFLPGLATGKITTAQAIADAPVNVRPVTDDQPFFYNDERGIPASLGFLLLVVLAGAVAIVPRGMRAPKRSNRRLHLGWWYFAGLGAAFMLVEVALIQKSAMLLPMPTVAAAIVIGSLLIGGAMGSLAASRVPLAASARRLPLYLALAGAMAMAYLLAFAPLSRAMQAVSDAVLPFPLGLAFLPLGFVMGIPFPTGLRLLKTLDPERVAAVWAVNGAFSVVGSVLAMALAMTAGFTAVILTGALLYGAIAWVTFASGRAGNLLRAIGQQTIQAGGSHAHEHDPSHEMKKGERLA